MYHLSYTIDVGPILDVHGVPIEIDASVEMPTITVGSEEFAPTGPAHLHVSLINTGAGIVASGTVDAGFTAVCSRCLVEFPLCVRGTVEGFFVDSAHDEALPEEQETGPILDGTVDLMDALVSSIVLELPYAPLHDPDCQGICVTCGADLTDSSCGCSAAEPESPFAVLKDLLPPAE